MDIKKQVVIVGGGEAWDSHDEYMEFLKNYDFTPEKLEKSEGKRWKELLQDNLGDNFDVIKVKMPCTKNSKYDEWNIWFEKYFPYLRDDVVLIGHSLGANFLAKYLSENNFPVAISQLHLVAGCYGWKGGFSLSESLNKLEDVVDNVFIYHSTDDDIVDVADARKYRDALPSAQYIEYTDRHHFITDDFPDIVSHIREALV